MNNNFLNNNHIIAHKVQNGLTRINNIKNIIAITSGKGGVGKSTIAFHLALQMAKSGLKIGLLDADIYGPSIPLLINNVDFKPEVSDGLFVPLEKYNMQIISFGFLIDKTQPAIWRGAIVNKAIYQLFYDTKWQDLDILIVDMPPGTGDIHLSMCQKIPLSATITVSTPQNLAIADVIKSINMYKKLGIPCLGVIENMGVYQCGSCGHQEHIFGNNIKQLLVDYQLPLLASMPLDINLNKFNSDELQLNQHDDKYLMLYKNLIDNILNQLSLLPKDFASKFGKITAIK